MGNPMVSVSGGRLKPPCSECKVRCWGVFLPRSCCTSPLSRLWPHGDLSCPAPPLAEASSYFILGVRLKILTHVCVLCWWLYPASEWIVAMGQGFLPVSSPEAGILPFDWVIFHMLVKDISFFLLLKYS